ncbi:MAG: TM2 domain-containing protein [Clostridia bacterium]
MSKKLNTSWLLNLILTILIDPIWQGIRRILKGKLLIGILWIITAGGFGIGWILDIVAVVMYHDIKWFA